MGIPVRGFPSVFLLYCSKRPAHAVESLLEQSVRGPEIYPYMTFPLLAEYFPVAEGNFGFF
jgi:hypothetical protein